MTLPTLGIKAHGAARSPPGGTVSVGCQPPRLGLELANSPRIHFPLALIFALSCMLYGRIILLRNKASSIYHEEPTSKGEAWPKVQMEHKQDTFFTFAPTRHAVKVSNHTCFILENAVKRYIQVPLNLYRISRQNSIKNSKWAAAFQRTYSGLFGTLTINLLNPCEPYPYLQMDESYNLTISPTSVLSSASIWGILHGLETASQLFYLSSDYTEVLINATTIVDYPSYPYRGFMLDTARHYISVNTILRTLDAMAMNKMNVFHWHIVDDESFPYQSLKLPELSEKGAFHPSLVYNMTHIQTIIAYARDRGIRVIPEFDFTGYVRSWGHSHPETLMPCYDEYYQSSGLGPFNPIKSETYMLLKDLLEEVQAVFPDQYLHFGGDEIALDCWSMHPQLQKYVYRFNMKNMQELHAMFLSRVMSFLRNDTFPIIWQEAFHLGIPVPPDAMVQIWKAKLSSEMKLQMIEALNRTHQVILSAPWHLDNLQNTFVQLYTPSPRDWIKDMVPRELLQYVAGGEACMWGDMVDDTNLLSRTWPRASAVAELLWADIQSIPDELAAANEEEMVSHMSTMIEGTIGRAQEQACRMRRRGLPAEPPLGPSVCLL